MEMIFDEPLSLDMSKPWDRMRYDLIRWSKYLKYDDLKKVHALAKELNILDFEERKKASVVSEEVVLDVQ